MNAASSSLDHVSSSGGTYRNDGTTLILKVEVSEDIVYPPSIPCSTQQRFSNHSTNTNILPSNLSNHKYSNTASWSGLSKDITYLYTPYLLSDTSFKLYGK